VVLRPGDGPVLPAAGEDVTARRTMLEEGGVVLAKADLLFVERDTLTGSVCALRGVLGAGVLASVLGGVLVIAVVVGGVRVIPAPVLEVAVPRVPSILSLLPKE